MQYAKLLFAKMTARFSIVYTGKNVNGGNHSPSSFLQSKCISHFHSDLKLGLGFFFFWLMAKINKFFIMTISGGLAKKKKKGVGGLSLVYGILEHKSVWSASCHCAFRQVIPVLNGGWKEECLSVRSVTLDQCELSGMPSCLGRAGVNWELSTMTLPLINLKSMVSLATFQQCCRDGHSSLLIISLSLEVLWYQLTKKNEPLVSEPSLSCWCSVWCVNPMQCRHIPIWVEWRSYRLSILTG